MRGDEQAGLGVVEPRVNLARLRLGDQHDQETVDAEPSEGTNEIAGHDGRGEQSEQLFAGKEPGHREPKGHLQHGAAQHCGSDKGTSDNYRA